MKQQTSKEIIDGKLANPEWVPMPYSYANFMSAKLLELGFYWEDDTPPHYKLRTADIIVTISPYPNVLIVEKRVRAPFPMELYCHKTIPQNENEFNDFWNKFKQYL